MVIGRMSKRNVAQTGENLRYFFVKSSASTLLAWFRVPKLDSPAFEVSSTRTCGCRACPSGWGGSWSHDCVLTSPLHGWCDRGLQSVLPAHSASAVAFLVSFLRATSAESTAVCLDRCILTSRESIRLAALQLVSERGKSGLELCQVAE